MVGDGMSAYSTAVGPSPLFTNRFAVDAIFFLILPVLPARDQTVLVSVSGRDKPVQSFLKIFSIFRQANIGHDWSGSNFSI